MHAHCTCTAAEHIYYQWRRKMIGVLQAVGRLCKSARDYKLRSIAQHYPGTRLAMGVRQHPEHPWFLRP